LRRAPDYSVHERGEEANIGYALTGNAAASGRLAGSEDRKAELNGGADSYTCGEGDQGSQANQNFDQQRGGK